MGLFGDFSDSSVGQNLLGTSPQQQRNTLLNISQAFSAPKNRGETTMGNVLGAVTQSSATRQKDSEQRMGQVLSAMPKGMNFSKLKPEQKAMVEDYLRTGDQTLLMSIDFGSGPAKAPETKKIFGSDGLEKTVQWSGTEWVDLGGSKASDPTKDAGTANSQDSASLEKKRQGFQAKVDAKTMTQTQMNSRMDAERSIFGGGTDPGRTAMANSNNKALVASWEKFDTENESALNSLPAINQSLTLINDGLYTGTLGEMASDFNKLSTSLGFAPVDANVGAEQFRVNSMKSVMDWIALTKGAISEAEMNAFAAASPGLSRTREGNRMILTTAKKAAQWKQNRSQAYDAIYAEASKNNTIPNARKLTSQVKAWERDNKLVLPTPAEVQAAQDGKQLASATAAVNSGSPLTAAAKTAGVTAQDWSNMPDADKALFE
jgi:hypothetical protein